MSQCDPLRAVPVLTVTPEPARGRHAGYACHGNRSRLLNAACRQPRRAAACQCRRATVALVTGRPATVALWRGLDRVAGLAKHVLIAAAIGLSAQLDVFYMAVAILGVLVFSWAHLLDVLAVPQLVKASQAGDQATFQRLFFCSDNFAG